MCVRGVGGGHGVGGGEHGTYGDETLLMLVVCGGRIGTCERYE